MLGLAIAAYTKHSARHPRPVGVQRYPWVILAALSVRDPRLPTFLSFSSFLTD